ncbi:MAG: Ldh family oxidoreductase [Patescibacteria group bacterium]|nr:Ldh family oxidoreductase [Patescibacteria group bacterium]
MKIKIKIKKIKKILKEKLEKANIEKDKVNFIINEFIENELINLPTHGLMVFSRWYKYLINRKKNKPIIKIKKNVLKIDGGGYPSQIFLPKIINFLTKKAINFGISLATIKNTISFLKASTPTLALSKKKLIGLSLMFTSSKVCAIEGFNEPFLGPHPLAISIPVKDSFFIFDLSLASISFNKFKKIIEEGREKSDQYLGVDKFGKKTNILKNIHSLLPIGGNRGFGFLLAIEMIVGGLLDYQLGFEKPEYQADNGILIIAINPSFFINKKNYLEKNKNFLNQIKKINKKAYIPGEKYSELRKNKQYLYLNEKLLDEISKL